MQQQPLVPQVCADVVVTDFELPMLAAIGNRKANPIIAGNQRRAHGQWIEPRKDAARKVQLPALGPIRIFVAPTIQPDPGAERDIPGRTHLVVLVPEAGEARLLRPGHVGLVDDPLRHHLARPGLRVVAPRRIDTRSSRGRRCVQIERISRGKVSIERRNIEGDWLRGIE